MAFRLGDEGVDRHHIILDLAWQGKVKDDVRNVVNPAVVVAAVLMAMSVFVIVSSLVMVVLMPVVMGMVVVAVLLLSVHRHGQMGACDTAFHRTLPLIADAGYAQAVQLRQEAVRVGQKLQQGGGQHVPGGPHGQVQI